MWYEEAEFYQVFPLGFCDAQVHIRICGLDTAFAEAGY